MNKNNSPLDFRGCSARLVKPAARLYRSFCFAPLLAFGIALGGVGAPAAWAQLVYNEAVSGDFSNSGLTPTVVSLHAGSNLIFGTTGRGNVIDRDYFTVTVPAGLVFSSLVELPGTTVGGALSFLGLQAGNQVTLPVNAVTANGLLGWTHYGSSMIGIDLFPAMAIPNTGSSGFTIPLWAGDYSFWIQDFNAGTFNYGFDLQLTAVPEPSSYAIAGAALLLMLVLRRRFATPAKI